jgi:hypothetical protein
MNYYYIFDILLVIAIFLGTKISYEKRYYMGVFDYFKIFIILSISAKLSSITAEVLQKLYILKADTYLTLILIAFIVNFFILFYGYKYIFQLSNKYINSYKVRTITAQLVSFLQVLFIFTFGIYLVMQLYLSKKYLYNILYSTYSYPKIEKFYKGFLNKEFVNMIINSDTSTNHSEVLFKSIKNSI